LIDNFNFRDMEHYGISILSATTVTVSNCQFHNSTRSLEIKGVPQQVNVRHCDFSALRAAQDVSAFYVTVQGDITVEDCTFRYATRHSSHTHTHTHTHTLTYTTTSYARIHHMVSACVASLD